MTNHIRDVFHFKIFRLREVKESDEFLLFDMKKKTYNQYNSKRLREILIDETVIRGINLSQYISDLGIDTLKVKVDVVVSNWIKQETVLIDNLSYKPCSDLIFNEDLSMYFNIYRKSNLLCQDKFEEGDFKYIKQLIMNLVGNNKEEYNYFLKWIAWQLQNPLMRLPTSIILQGEQGTGKSQFCNKVLKKIFANNFCEIGQTDINADYNDYILGKQLIVANEVIHNDNKFLVPDKLKNYVTDEFIRISKKFKNGIVTRNYAQWIFVTNNDIPLKIDKDDRRYSVFKSKKLVNGYELIKNLDENLDEELDHFVNYLFSLKLNFDEVSKPLHNEAKIDLIKANYNSVEEFCEHAKEIGGFDKLNEHFHNHDFNNNLDIHQVGENICFITDNLYQLYQRFCFSSGINYKFSRANFTRHMKKQGFEQSFIYLDNKSHRVLKIINIEVKE